MGKSDERRLQILAFMRAEIHQKGYPPTVREICQAIGVKSTSTVHKDLAMLEKEGYIRKDPSKPRALMLVEEEELYESPGKISGDSLMPVAEVVEIPLVGRVAAGTPILAEENVEDMFPLPARLVGSGTHFMLTVHGESMIEAGIMDGDYILVRQQNTANNGDMVVAMIDGFESEATVKTFYRENGHVRLQPENQSMSPIIVKDVSILGTVKGVFRYF